MARIIKLPARAGSIEFSPVQVADILLSLDAVEKGEGVIVDDGYDTAPKARARTRVIKPLVEAGVTLPWDEYLEACEAADVAPDENLTENEDVTLDGVNVRTHTVEDGGFNYPVLSVKIAAA